MNENNQSQTPVNLDLVFDEFKKENTRLSSDVIMLRAYVRQLQKELEDSKSKEEALIKKLEEEVAKSITSTEIDKNKK